MTRAHGWIALGLAGILAAFLHTPAAAQAEEGRAVYDKWCAGCHGLDGKGAGPAADRMLPRPRDFTTALYQIRSTASGELPLDSDIRHVVDVGMPGTAMPAWEDRLSEDERSAVVEYLKTFSRFFQQGEAPEPIELGDAPGESEEGIAEGQELYQRTECWKCHGNEGRGDGQSAPTQEDDAGFPIRPADLTENWHFNGGGTVEDIYRRLRTGLDGTPMPSFSDQVDAGVMTDEQLWRIAQYVRSLSPPEAPQIREVVRAIQVEGPLPSEPGDSAWTEVERFYIPLVGQVIVTPRWFAPTVDGVWVQGLHNGAELALRFSWSDPSNSPDPVWDDWQRLVLAAMGPEGETPTESMSLVDQLIVQFPRRIPTGMERPYFLMGNDREPVYTWSWASGTTATGIAVSADSLTGADPIVAAPTSTRMSLPFMASEGLGRGLGRIDALELQGLQGSAVFDQGEWQLVLKRSLTTADTLNQLQFRIGEAIPMAFFAADGSNAEGGTRGSVSTWYFVYLDRPAEGVVYVAPIVATILTAGLGLLVVARAQRRERKGDAERAQSEF